jgi:hypothetical protein
MLHDLKKRFSSYLNEKCNCNTLFLDCPVLRPGKGALASNRDIAFGTSVTFTCPTGQEFATGQQKIVTECQPGGLWSVDYIPDCQGMHKYMYLIVIKHCHNI